jgi:hypothetical protein
MITQEYKLLIESSEENLEAKVNRYLSEGWKLYGNPVIAMTSGARFGQAIIRDVEQPGARG